MPNTKLERCERLDDALPLPPINSEGKMILFIVYFCSQKDAKVMWVWGKKGFSYFGNGRREAIVKWGTFLFRRFSCHKHFVPRKPKSIFHPEIENTTIGGIKSLVKWKLWESNVSNTWHRKRSQLNMGRWRLYLLIDFCDFNKKCRFFKIHT